MERKEGRITRTVEQGKFLLSCTRREKGKKRASKTLSREETRRREKSAKFTSERKKVELKRGDIYP
jgi:hypothetical protein